MVLLASILISVLILLFDIFCFSHLILFLLFYFSEKSKYNQLISNLAERDVFFNVDLKNKIITILKKVC